MSPDPLHSLPHGPEFRFIDRLLALQPGVSATAEYDVRGTEPFLAGHFPGDPIFPGVLLVEAAAQLAGIITQSAQPNPSAVPLRLTAIRSVKILGAARPGETLRITATLLRQLGNLAQAQARITVGERVVMEGELTLSGATEPPAAP